MFSCDMEDGRQKSRLTIDSFADLQTPEYALIAQNVNECLGHILSSDRDSTTADHLLRSYYKGGGAFVWVDRMGLSERADTLLAYLQDHATQQGFSAEAFRLRQIGQLMQGMRQESSGDGKTSRSQQAAQVEYLLSKAFLRYAHGQRYGFADPYRLFNKLDIREQDTARKITVYSRLFDVDVEQPPRHYVAEALRHVQADSVGEYLRSVEPRDSIYWRFVAELATTHDANRRQLLLTNMERRRWRTRHPDHQRGKYVLVNVAAQHLWAVAPDSIFNMRVVCGARRTKTPLLTSAINLIQVNPEWIIPMSIIRNEVARHAGDSAYFARHNYYITDRSSGQRLSPASVSAGALASGKYRVSQQGGPGNSLGRIVFRFPNEFSVYLHDTSNPGAFNYASRSLSHGCVRVQRPFDLARFMLTDPDEWMLDRLRISMGLRPEGEQGLKYMEQHADEPAPHRLVNSISVKPNVPVFITYYTIYPDPETGKLVTWPDPYGYDAVVQKAIKPFI